VLAQHVGPARLIAAREPDEAAAPGQVIQDGHLLGHADRVLGAHDVPQLPNPHVASDGRPVAGEHARAGADLVALGPEVVLDGRHAPEAQLVGGLHDLVPAGQGLLV
jgi:hypothetical protein